MDGERAVLGARLGGRAGGFNVDGLVLLRDERASGPAVWNWSRAYGAAVWAPWLLMRQTETGRPR
jgi:hypothetical protein